MAKYYTLVTRDADGRWSPQFGDYSRSVVKDEKEYYLESYDYKKKDVKILTTQTDHHTDITQAIKELNDAIPTHNSRDI